MILLEMMLEVVIGVLVMEVDKVADEVTDMEVDKVFFFIGQVLDLPNTGNHTQHITCTIRLEIALS